ncbi:hypothetical protein AX16_007913 [Volvariella volvacea WC 439]|nr:hypothetical protein AX16_007913 [Volvariella volvacea WC 439]
MPDKSKLYRRLAKETRGHYVGPMPPHDFVGQFMPWNTNNGTYLALEPSSERVEALQAMGTMPERQRYTKFVEALSGWPVDDFTVAKTTKRKVMKCFIDLKDTHSHRDVACASLGVDHSAYNARSGHGILTRAHVRTMDFANLEFFAEDKGSVRSDGFIDPPGDEYTHQDYFHTEVVAPVEDENEQSPDADLEDEEEEDLDIPAADQNFVDVVSEVQDEQIVEEEPKFLTDFPFENHSDSGINTRGQIACYAGVTMAVQFRLHMFSILLCGRYARFIRWDRSSAIVSRRFDFVDNPYIVFDFFKRYGQLTHAQRGFNPDVSLATKDQGVTVRRQLRKFAPEYWCGRALDLSQEKIAEIDTQSFVCWVFNGKKYIVPAPLCDTGGFSPFGRASRGRLVYELEEGKLRYLKDSWREDSPCTKPEAEIYRLLENSGVEYVARMSDGGDTGHETVGHECTSYPWVSKNKRLLVRHLHNHIIVLVDIGRDIKTFKTAHQLVICIADAMEGHKQALEKVGVLHRDISVGNIMMTRDPDNRRGFLIDWDHCIIPKLMEKYPGERRIGRTGTWQFLSCYLLQNPGGTHAAVDDRESALHVLTWMALLFLPHKLAPGSLKSHLEAFDYYYEQDGFDRGGDHKALLVRSGGPLLGFSDRLTPISRLIKELSRVFGARYDEDMPEEFLKALDDPTWLIQTLRKVAQQLPNDSVRDWTDNQAKLEDDQLKRKRKGEDYGERPLTKRSRDCGLVTRPPMMKD